MYKVCEVKLVQSEKVSKIPKNTNQKQVNEQIELE